MQRFIFCLFTLLFATLNATETDHRQTDRRQVRSLADRGLFDAAEKLCEEKFEQNDITPTDKVLLATELARSYSLHLLLLEPEQRIRLVWRLETLERNWLIAVEQQQNVDFALARIILRLQIAMAYQSLGEYQRLEADTASLTTRQAAYQQARSTLEDALERLKLCQQELQALRQRTGINADAALTQRMSALESSITMQRGMTQKSLAQTHQAEAERNFELKLAAETLSGLAARNSNEPIIVQCKIEKAECHRLAGKLDQCAEILNQLRTVALSPTCQLRLETEWIRFQIAQGNIAETRRHYTADKENAQLYPEFDIARLELFLVNDTGRNIRSDTIKVIQLEQAIGRQFGPHWAKRAQLLMLTSDSTELNSAEMLRSRGDNLYRESRFAEAANLYEQAAMQADAKKQAENMFRYNHLAAHSWMKALEQLPSDETKVQHQQRIVPLLRKLVAQQPEHPEALALHSLAMNLQGQIVLVQPEALDDYLALVEEHSERWNDSPQLPVAYRLSVMLLERQGRLDEASALLPRLDLEQLSSLPPEIQRLRAKQLDAEGETQAAVDILIALLNQRRRDPSTLRLFAEILTRQQDASSLNRALQFWGDLERISERGGEVWWAAREGILVVLVKLDRRDEAQQSYNMLRILYPDLGGAERKKRLMKLFS